MDKLVTFFIAFILGLALCQAADMENAESESAVVPGKYAWRMEADFPRFDNEKVNRDIRLWLDQAIPSAKDYLLGFAKSDLPEDGFEVFVSYQLTHATPTILSVIFTISYSPRLAAHPSTATAVLTYDLTTGKRLGLGDLFANPEKAMQIMAENGKRLVSEEKEMHDEAATTVWFMEGFEAKEENYKALGVEKDGVRVYFQQYQILPYACGMPSPLIPLELIKPAGPNPAIWPANQQ